MGIRYMSAQPAMRVHDLPSAVAFYELLGFRQVYRNADFHQVMQKDNVVIHLSTVEGAPGTCQIMVDDVERLYEKALVLKLKILYDGLGERSWGCRDFTIQDPDGNRFTFSQRL